MTTSVETRHRPKGDKRARTRAALIEAARELIHETGYEHVTMEAVARRAGMTSGAIYGNFKNRDALFVAVGHAYWPAIRPKIRPDSTFAEKMRAIAEATLAALPQRQAAGVGRLKGMAHALSDPSVALEAREVTAASYDWGAGWLKSVADEGGLPMSAEALVVVIHALQEGLTFQRLITPDLVPDEVFYAAFEALARPASPSDQA